MDLLISWAISELLAGAGSIRKLADKVGSVLTGLWHTLTALGVNVRRAWQDLSGIGRALEHALAAMASETTLTATWIIDHLVPAQARKALHDAIDAAGAFARRVESDAAMLARAAERDAVSALDAVAAGIAGEVRAVEHDTAVALDEGSRAWRVVSTVLSSPDALASWAAGAIARAVLRFAWDHGRDLARALLRVDPQTIVNVAGDVEGWLADAIG